MQTLAISAVPNQTFSTTLDDNRYDFGIFQANGVMCCNIAVNEVQILSGQRITNGTFLIPFLDLQGQNGNFLLLTQNEALPDFTQFGSTQTLIYMSYDEILAAVNSIQLKAQVVPPYAVAV